MDAVDARRDPGKADVAKEGPCKGWFFSCVHNALPNSSASRRGKARLDYGWPHGIEYVRSPGLISQACRPVVVVALSARRVDRPVPSSRETTMSDDAVAAPRRVIPDKSSCFYPPRKVPERRVTFINLEDKPEDFNINKVKKQWRGRS